MMNTHEGLPITLVTKWGSRAVIDERFCEPRLELLKPNVAVMAELIKEGRRVPIVMSGARLLGRGMLQRNRKYQQYINERERTIHADFDADRDKLTHQLEVFQEDQIRHEHRIGQKRLMAILGHEFAECGVTVNEVLLDGTEVDLTGIIKRAALRGEGVAFNGNGAVDPNSKARDNDVNLSPVVRWVEPNDPSHQVIVATIMHPNTPALLDSSHIPIRVYRGGEVTALQHRDRAISTGGPVSKTRNLMAIKVEFPNVIVVLSGMSDHVVSDALEGRGGTLFELRPGHESSHVRIAS